LNTYGYVGGNPLTGIDPFGLYCFSLAERNGIKGAAQGAIEGARFGLAGIFVGAASYGVAEYAAAELGIPSLASGATALVNGGNFTAAGIATLVTASSTPKIALDDTLNGAVSGFLGGYTSGGKGYGFLRNLTKGAGLGALSGFGRDLADVGMDFVESFDDCGCKK